MPNLKEIFEESVNDYSSVNLDDKGVQARIYCGFKIIKEGDEISIYNASKDRYEEISDKEYLMFFERGWKESIHLLALKKYKAKLLRIEQRVKDEINGRNNAKFLIYLKKSRHEYMNKYYKLTQKSNKQ